MTEKWKQRGIAFLPVFVCLVGMAALSVLGVNGYRQAVFRNLSGFCEVFAEENPEAAEQVLSAMKKYRELPTAKESAFLEQYGYREADFGSGPDGRFLMGVAIVCLAAAGCFAFSLVYQDCCCQRRIGGLTAYLEKVNAGADGSVLEKKEDAFSRLSDELYKTVTELYQTREAAVLAKRSFADNLANIAHQLKTPITAAALSLQLLEKEAFGSRDGQGGAADRTPSCTFLAQTGQIKRQLERLNRLEESLLTLSKIDAGTLELERESVDIYTALNLAAENLGDLPGKEGISVFIPDNGCVEMMGDLEWTMEALMNLMKNCMEHSPQGGVVHCDYSGNPLYAEIRIWDEGEGFCKEDIPYLFKRFYRGKRAVGSGTGIGLALARSVFEMQNGNVTAWNRPEGGACFEIRIYRH